MQLKHKTFTTTLADTELHLEVSELAKQTNASVVAYHGDTALLATVVMSETDKAGDFFPLTVDYEERFYAAGKILGSRFVRREGRPSDDATLSARLIDRTIRPLFDPRLRREIQVTITVLAYDEVHDPDEVALIAVSAALGISDIPWKGPVAGVRHIEKDAQGNLRYHSFFAGTKDRVNMIEFEGIEVSEKEAVQVFQTSQKEIQRLATFQEGMIKEIGKPKASVNLAEPDAALRGKVEDFLRKGMETALHAHTVEELKRSLFEAMTVEKIPPEQFPLLEMLFEEELDRFVHHEVIAHGKRPDGRALDQIRPLHAEVSLLRRTHGSALFMRGDTQVLAVTTLGTPSAEQLIETMEAVGTRRFMLHYNFPKFSTGEVGRSRGPGRREIGHGALAAKAIINMLPSKDEFPYTIRVVAETLSSNGSSSMASTCATTLSLMDAGVPLKKPVAGIAIGLMSDEKGTYKILTDIQGPEDHYGDMDFKVAGTDAGITAIQMDVKIDGITEPIYIEALERGRKARLEILEVLRGALPAPRPKVSPFAPTIVIITIPVDRIGEVIGPGGKIINGLIASTGGAVSIDIEQTGKVYVAGTDVVQVENIVTEIKSIVRDFVVGEIVEGPIIKILDFGAIVDLGGGRDGMAHVSELKEGYVKQVEDVVHLGDLVRAKIIRAENGRIGLSLKGVPQP